MSLSKLKAVAAALAVAVALGAGGLLYRAADGPAVRAADGPAAPSEADALRKENELLKINLQAVLEKLRAQEAAQPGDAKLDGDDAAKRFAAVAGRFKYKVPFEIGETEFKEGARIEILEVWGTKPKIEIGGQYIVRGQYAMPSHDPGTLYFNETATATGPGWDGTGPEMDCQYTWVRKGQGEFTLLHGMGGPVSFHLTLVGEDAVKGRSDTVADIYFGTGDNVYRKKP